MKKTLYPFAPLFMVSILVITVLAPGCKSADEEPVDEDGMEIRLAPIEEVRVNIAESYPVQIFVYIRGGLADACTELHEVITERNGNTINIEVTTERPKEAECAQVYTTFEKNVALGSDFNAGEIYTIKVNDAKPVTFIGQ